MRISRLLSCAILCAAVVAEAANEPLPRVAAAPSPVTLSEADNGRTLEVAPETHIELALHSTYWQDISSSDPGIVAPQGSPQIVADLKACMPGAGCGTITQVFAAVGVGQATLTAGRKVCGEVLPCPLDQQHFSVTIVVRSRG